MNRPNEVNAARRAPDPKQGSKAGCVSCLQTHRGMGLPIYKCIFRRMIATTSSGGMTEEILYDNLKTMAIKNGYRTLFVGAQALVTGLIKARQERRLEEKLKQLSQTKLLVIDEIGDIPIERLGANRFFQLISRRYEKGSMILASNQNNAHRGRSSLIRALPALFSTGFCTMPQPSISRVKTIA